MASEYAIRLKATLDTSSIQSELQKLRTAQQGGAGNGANGQGTGGGSALGGLGNTLAKLNSTMLNLQKSVDLLARQMRAQNAGMRGGEVWSPPVLVRGFQGPQASGGIIATGGAYQQFRDIQRGLYNQANNTIRNSALPSYNRIKALQSARQDIHQALYGSTVKNAGVDDGRVRIVGFNQPVEESPSMSDSERMRYLWRKYKIEKEIKAEAQNLRAGINKFDSLDKYNKALEKQKQAMLRKEYDEQRSMHRKSMGLWMASMLAQETGQEVMNWGLNQDMFSAKQSLGVKTGASIKAMGGGMLWGSSVASLATGMGSSAAVAGPIGVAAAAVGMLVSVAQSMSDYSEKLQEAKQAQEQLTTVVKQRAKSMSNNFGPSVEKWQAEGMLRGYQSEIPFLVSQILNPYGDGEVGRYREFAKSVRVNTSYNRDVAYRRMIDAQTRMLSSRNALSMMETPEDYRRRLFENIESGVLERNSLGSYRRKLTAEERFKAVENANTAVRYYMQEFQDLQSQAAADERSYATWKNVADQLQKAAEHAKELERAVESTVRYWNNQEGRRNLAAINNASDFGVDRILNDQVNRFKIFSGDVLLNRKLSPREQFNQLVGELGAARESRSGYLNEAFGLNRMIQFEDIPASQKEELIKRRDWAMRQAGVQGDITKILENALRQIDTTQWKPNLQNLTSLSQFGFNMGENNDAVQIMERYWERHINLTREIKLEIQKGVKTEAVYN